MGLGDSYQYTGAPCIIPASVGSRGPPELSLPLFSEMVDRSVTAIPTLAVTELITLSYAMVTPSELSVPGHEDYTAVGAKTRP